MSKTTNKQSIASMTGASELLSIMPDFEEYDMIEGERRILRSLLQEAAQCRLDRDKPYPKEWAHFISRRHYEYATELRYRDAIEALRSFIGAMRSKS